MSSVPAGIQPSGWAERRARRLTVAGALLCHARRSGLPPRVRGGGMRTVAPAISACGPLHGRQAPLPGRQQTPRRQSRSLSGAQRALRTRGGTPGYPRKSAQCHVNAVFSAPLVPRGPPLRRPHGLQSEQPACSRRVAVPSRLSLPGADHRSRQQRQHAYHRTHDLGHSGPFTVVKRRRLAASGPRGVRVGRAAALRGPCKPAGYPEAPPEIRIVPVNVARQRRSQRHTRHRWPPRDSPRLLPNLEQQSDTGAPATTSYPPPHHASLYADPSTVDAVSSAKVVYQAPRTGHPGTIWPEWAAFTGIRSH